MAHALDPSQYEIFSHRLFNILEEGRVAISMVSGSPVVVEGGETMCSFYLPDGDPILTSAGILLHCTGARDFIVKALEWYEDDPGIYDGDQLFFNDPYIGGQHLPDQIVIKPIFYQSKRIAWVGSFTHTSETGGLEPGGMPAASTEIFHEGIKILGLKVVEGGKFRKDVFNTIVKQVRDPHLVGLDLKGKVAANNVCARGFMQLVKKYGIDFVTAASNKIIEDSEKMARAKLRALPDGIWRSRLYGDSTGLEEKPFRVMCTMTKRGDEVTFDLTGSSPQNEGSVNSTLPATWGGLFVVLASQLFWDVPWNQGMIAPVHLVAPEGTVVNCKFPAACANGVHTVNCLITESAHECIAKMLYAGGILDDINSGWRGICGGRPYFGGINRKGEMFSGIILDSFIAGIGATPCRDGVDSGGNMMNPSSNVSDVEIIELNMPLLYLARRNATDSGGFGKFNGGMGPEMTYMIHGTDNIRFGLTGAARRCPGNFGMYGGYPSSLQESRYVLKTNLKRLFTRSKTITSFDDSERLTGEKIDPPNLYPLIPVRDYDIVVSRIGAGGGFGDPIDRHPELVLADVRRGATSVELAKKVFGVVVKEKDALVNQDRFYLDLMATKKAREKIRQERLRAKPAGLRVSKSDQSAN